ncbi:hypothetical protein, partial [Enterobacter hormaechei]|uniref:hypothetical protein n=1 Tax=Enterobacter hormaechei TaxID=158836 RepID=UPI00316B7B2A
ESLKTTVTNMGDSVGGWFKEKLGIHSPSRVFMGFGDNIAQGAVLWIGRALLMNPIGLAITAVAAAAYLIYRNWGAVSSWFKQR